MREGDGRIGLALARFARLEDAISSGKIERDDSVESEGSVGRKGWSG